MSNISQALDDINAKIATILPTYYKMTNPYDIDVNDDLTVEKAWGLTMGEGRNTNEQLSCRMGFQRDLKLTMTRKVFAGQLQRNTEALAARYDAEKQLAEDWFLVIKEFETNTPSMVISSLVYNTDSGLEFIKAERSDVLKIQTVFVLKYQENT